MTNSAIPFPGDFVIVFISNKKNLVCWIWRNRDAIATSDFRTCDDLHTNKHYGLNVTLWCRDVVMNFNLGNKCRDPQMSAGEKRFNWEKKSFREQKSSGEQKSSWEQKVQQTKVQGTKVLHNWLENKSPENKSFGNKSLGNESSSAY